MAIGLTAALLPAVRTLRRSPAAMVAEHDCWFVLRRTRPRTRPWTVGEGPGTRGDGG